MIFTRGIGDYIDELERAKHINFHANHEIGWH